MHKGENNRDGQGKDIDIATGKEERKPKGKGKERKEESKEKVSRWDEERGGGREICTGTLANFYFTIYRFRYWLRK